MINISVADVYMLSGLFFIQSGSYFIGGFCILVSIVNCINKKQD